MSSNTMQEEEKQITFEKDYNEIMKNALKQVAPPPMPQWTNPGDYFVKFSLYEETPNSITSTDTFLIPEFNKDSCLKQ